MIPIIVMDRESCNRLSLSIIAEPLTNTLSSDGGDFLIVADIVTLIPVFHFCRMKCFDIFRVSNRSDDSSRNMEFFHSSASSIIPFFRILIVLEERISCLLEVIREIESSPPTRNNPERIRNPCDHGMADSVSLFEHLDIRLDISTFVFDNRKKVSEKFLFPGVLWRIPDIESREPAGFEIFSIDRGTRSMVVEISRIISRAERDHRETIAENRGKGKKLQLAVSS